MGSGHVVGNHSAKSDLRVVLQQRLDAILKGWTDAVSIRVPLHRAASLTHDVPCHELHCDWLQCCCCYGMILCAIFRVSFDATIRFSRRIRSCHVPVDRKSSLAAQISGGLVSVFLSPTSTKQQQQ